MVRVILKIEMENLNFFFLKKKIDIDECLTNNGGCSANAICTNTIGSFSCTCKIGYVGDGMICSSCNENEYPFNETTCLSCPENSTSLSSSTSIIDCKCISFNHYLDVDNLICLPCDYGFKVDEILNVCQSMIFFLKKK